jgi:hypothetical protein
MSMAAHHIIMGDKGGSAAAAHNQFQWGAGQCTARGAHQHKN